MHKIKIISAQQKNTIENEGWIAFIKGVFSSIQNRVFFYRIYYLFEGTTKEPKIATSPDIPDLSLRIVSTPDEFDRLVAEGFNFHDWNSTFQMRLNKGAIALGAFKGNELAHMSWIAISEKGQKSLHEPPIKVDFKSNQALVGGLWTKPQYRGLGIAPLAIYKRLDYLQKRGIMLSRGLIRKDNMSSLRLRAKQGDRPGTSRFYAIGRHLRILWWESWKETPINSIEP